MSKLNVMQRAVAIKNGVQDNTFNPKGMFHVEHRRDNKIIAIYDFPNGVTIEGKNFNLDVMFHGTAAGGTWYLGLINLTGYTALSENDDYDNINQAANGWDEFTDYTDANNGDSAVTRPEWQEGAASAKSITNSTTCIYDITANGTVKGIFCAALGAGALNKDDHAADGKLWATALFSAGDVAVLIGDQLKVTYTVSC